MKHRKVVKRTEPAQPERVREIHVITYTCDQCGAGMPDHNMSGGFLPDLEETVPRNRLQVFYSQENFSGSDDGFQRIERDYCDNCVPDIWREISRILAYRRTENEENRGLDLSPGPDR